MHMDGTRTTASKGKSAILQPQHLGPRASAEKPAEQINSLRQCFCMYYGVCMCIIMLRGTLCLLFSSHDDVMSDAVHLCVLFA